MMTHQMNLGLTNPYMFSVLSSSPIDLHVDASQRSHLFSNSDSEIYLRSRVPERGPVILRSNPG